MCERIRLFGSCQVKTLSLKDKVNQLVKGKKGVFRADVKRVRLVSGIYYGKVFLSNSILAVKSENCSLWSIR
jgi:hypothetical protein